MANSKGTFKRHYPRMGKCFCCCCCSADTSFKVCTILMCIGYAITLRLQLHSDYIMSVFKAISVAILLAVVISHILLLIGVKKVKFSYMNQFKIVYLIFIIFEIVSLVIISMDSFKIISNPHDENKIAEYKKAEEIVNNEMLKLTPNYKPVHLSDDEIAKNLRQSAIIAVLTYIVPILFIIYYYLVTCSYIEDVEETVYEHEYERELESGKNGKK